MKWVATLCPPLLLAVHIITSSDLLCSFSQDENYGSEEVEDLRTLVSNLRQLLDLHTKYNCRLSLSLFEKVCIQYANYSNVLITHPRGRGGHSCLPSEVYGVCWIALFLVKNVLNVTIRERYAVWRSSCWTKWPLRNWSPPQWKTTSCLMLRNMAFLWMSFFCSTSR